MVTSLKMQALWEVGNLSPELKLADLEKLPNPLPEQCALFIRCKAAAEPFREVCSFEGDPAVALAIGKLFVARNGADINLADEHGKTPLHYAAENGQLEVLRWLLTRVINVNLANEEGNTALHLAAMYGHEAIVRALLANPRIAVNLVNRGNKAPFQMAIRAGNEGIVDLLLSDPRIDINLTNRAGNTALDGQDV